MRTEIFNLIIVLFNFLYFFNQQLLALCAAYHHDFVRHSDFTAAYVTTDT
jgi:hypothetical protein